MRPALLARALALIAVATVVGPLASRPARAHVAASVDDNNRYLKLSLLGDRVRLAYTVFFGEVPGKAMRPSIDANRDGRLDPAETQAFAARLGDEVAAQLRAVLDGKELPVRFSQVSFGAVSELVSGGAFSIDLVATLCMEPAAQHQLGLRDRFAVPRPGETEVYLEDGPGISITSATLGAQGASQAMFRFAGAVPALGEPGLRVAFAVAPDALVPAAGSCEVAQQKRRGQGGEASAGWPSHWLRRWLPLGCALLGLAALLGVWQWQRRRHRQSPRRRPQPPAPS